MKKVFFTFFYFPFGVLLFSCGAPITEHKKPSPDSIKDSVKQIKVCANPGMDKSFSCKINGLDFNYNGTSQSTYGFDDDSMQKILLLKFNNDSGQAIGFQIIDDDSAVTFPWKIEVRNCRIRVLLPEIFWWENAGKINSYYDDPTDESYITITKWDKKAHKISGTFVGELLPCHGDKKNIKITEGKFEDVSYSDKK